MSGEGHGKFDRGGLWKIQQGGGHGKFRKYVTVIWPPGHPPMTTSEMSQKEPNIKITNANPEGSRYGAVGNTLIMTSHVEQLYKFATENVLPYPTYEDMSNLCPKLVECSFLNHFTIGAGSSLEKAKQNAAQLMLERLEKEDLSKLCTKFQILNVNTREVPKESDATVQKHSVWPSFCKNSTIKEKARKPILDVMSQRSPILVLQEITQQRLIQPPIYNIENSFGIGRFLCTVKVMGITARAYGCNKKDAKHRAAKRALEIIGFKNNSNPNDDEDDQSDEDDEVCQPQCSPQKVKALQNSRFISDSVKTDNSPCQFKYLPTSSSNSLSLAYHNCNTKATDKAKDLEAPGYGSIGNTEKCERQGLQISSSNAWLSDCKQIAAERIKALGSPKYRSIGIGCNINSNANNCDDDDDDEGDEMYQPQCSQISTENYDYKEKSVGVERSLERPGYISNNFAFYSSSNYGAFDENDELYPPQSLPKSKASEDPRYASNDITADHEKNQIKYTPPKSSSGNGNTLPPTTYVGYLNKFALERQVPYPKYSEIKHSGIIFVVECVFWSALHCTVGTGPNVESAKEKAAQLMLQRLEEEEELNFSLYMMSNNKVTIAELYQVSKDRRFWEDFRRNPVVQEDANGPIQDLINTRNPISVLQDIMQQRRIRLPIYNIERGMNIGQPFVCTVEVMGITAKAYGHNKKDAKYNAAERALEILGLKVNSNPNDDGPESSSTSSSNSLPSTNYVGQLNEIASGSRFPYPTYQEHKGSLSSFVVECQFLNQSTMGTGPTKKSAKQRAAQLMLEGLPSISLVR